MRTTEANQLQSLRAVQSFLDRHRGALADIATGGARRRLDEALASLELHVVDQAASELAARSYTQRYRALRRRLVRTHMAPLALVARAAEPPVPALEPFSLPRGKPTAHRLAAVAYGMATAAAPHAETFTSAGLPTDFAEQLVRAADAMLEAITARGKERGRHRGATHGIRAKLASARRIVRVLDAFVTAAFEDDAVMLAAWSSATHVRRTARPTADATPVIPSAPLRLLVAEVPETRGVEPNGHTFVGRPPVALRGRVFTLLAGYGRARVAAGM